MKRKIKTVPVLAGVFLMAACLLTSCGSRHDKAPAGDKPAVTNPVDSTGSSEETKKNEAMSGEADEASKEADEAGKDTEEDKTKAAEEGKKIETENITKDSQADSMTAGDRTDNTAADAQTGDILHFVDVFGKEYEVSIRKSVPVHGYDRSKFRRSGDRLSYEDASYTSVLGVDVSHHQGNIDWEKVRAAGMDFAILRIGYRGYGGAGVLGLDREFERNVQEARKAGLEVGVYFFAQAVNEAEAMEEAEFVLEHLKEYDIQLPVVYDPESILDDEARTDNVTPEQFTKNTRTFCDRIKAAGYQPMIYANMLWEAFELDLEQLSDLPVWYADYEPLPQTPYHFDYWQYTNQGSVDGITGNVDINIRMIPLG